jgi:hypothetical protein
MPCHAGCAQAHEHKTLPQVELWRRGMTAMAEQSLVGLKSMLFDSATGPADLVAIRSHEWYLAHLRQLAGEPLIAEYEFWQRHHPALTHGMMRAMAGRYRAERQALAEYYEEARPCLEAALDPYQEAQ